MEMNTRLQVEHTVTEAVTGLDLVEWQLRVAAGEPLPLGQSEVRFEGHAIEARVYAEDPERGFLPSAGRLALLEWPELPCVRVDAGFATGDTVPDCYDSLLGKIIAWAPERGLASARLADALASTYCAGVHTNERWLRRILRSARFLEVRHDVALLDQAAGEFAGPPAAAPEALILAGLALHGGEGGTGPGRTESLGQGGADGDRGDEDGERHHRPLGRHGRGDSLRPRRARARGERAPRARARQRELKGRGRVPGPSPAGTISPCRSSRAAPPPRVRRFRCARAR